MAKGEHINSQKLLLKKLRIIKRFLTKFLKFCTLGLLFLIGSCLVVIFTYHQTYAGKIYPEVFIGDIGLGGKTVLEATQLLASYLPSPTTLLTLVTGGQIWEMPISEINLSYDATASAKKAYQLGRSGHLVSDLFLKWQAIAYRIRFAPTYQYDKDILDKKILELSALVDVRPIPSTLTILGQQVITTPSRAGQMLDKQKFLHDFRYRLESLQFSDPIILSTITLEPALDENKAFEARQILEILITTPLTLTFSEKSWTIDASQALNFFLPIGTPSAQPRLTYLLGKGGQVLVSSLPKTSPPKESPLISSLAVTTYLSSIALEIDREPQDALFQFAEGKVQVFKPSYEGQKLDIEEAKELISKALTEELELTDKNFLITLPVKTIAPKITTSEVNNLGIKELVGHGFSDFRGSSKPRVHNIVLSSGRLNGVLIPPGEVFSFNESLGEVSKASGYQQAYVIKRDRTILDDGGGVCQVSTTLFRAALNAGLSIVERTAHAYRVIYYERVHPVGFDATVYPPAVDLKFKNDTPTYILIQSQVDQTTNELIFDLYGTSDGRKVELGKPVVTNQVPPPEALYQEDPNLPKGEVKQIERPNWGANVSFSYKVTRDGEILQNEEIYSRYRPWGAVFLVGTKA